MDVIGQWNEDRSQTDFSGEQPPKLQMVPKTAAIVLVMESAIQDCLVPRSPTASNSSSCSQQQQQHQQQQQQQQQQQSTTSSIGACCDDDFDDNADEEVQSPLRTGPLECMDTLESSLPLKRGLSQFFDGKSRSFTSLKEVSSTDQLPKPQSPFKKRRLLLLQHRNNNHNRIPVSKSSASLKFRKNWSPPTKAAAAFVRVGSLGSFFSISDHIQRSCA